MLAANREVRPASHYDLAVPIKVVIAEDNALLREGIGRVVSEQADMKLLGAAGDLDGLRSLIGDGDPDVVVTDIRMPPTSTDEGVRVATELRESRPGIGVVVLSRTATPRTRSPFSRGGRAAAPIS